MQEVEQRRSSCRGNRTTEDLGQAIVIVRLAGEVAVIEVADQQALTFEMAADDLPPDLVQEIRALLTVFRGFAT